MESQQRLSQGSITQVQPHYESTKNLLLSSSTVTTRPNTLPCLTTTTSTETASSMSFRQGSCDIANVLQSQLVTSCPAIGFEATVVSRHILASGRAVEIHLDLSIRSDEEEGFEFPDIQKLQADLKSTGHAVVISDLRLTLSNTRQPSFWALATIPFLMASGLLMEIIPPAVYVGMDIFSDNLAAGELSECVRELLLLRMKCAKSGASTRGTFTRIL